MQAAHSNLQTDPLNEENGLGHFVKGPFVFP